MPHSQTMAPAEPPWADILIRPLRACMYLWAVVTGVGMILSSSPSVASIDSLLPGLVGTVFVAFGALCTVATITHRWIVEWVGLFFLTAVVTIYGVAGIYSSLSTPTRWAATGAIAMLGAACLIRLADLTVFYIKALNAAKAKQKAAANGD